MNLKKQPPVKVSLDAEGAVKKSGRVSFDSRGNAVWEWAMKTGIFKRDIDTKRLEALAANHLEIDSVTSSAGDPYNSSHSGGERVLSQLTGKTQQGDPRSKRQQWRPRLWPFNRPSRNED